MKKILFQVVLSFLILPSFAANKITGKIIDAANQNPLEFVSVAIYKPANKTPLAGVSTNNEGKFTIPNISDGKYIISVSFLGYNTVRQPVTVSGADLDMGSVSLKENSKTLKEVEVTAQGTQMKFEVDKKVFSVDKNIAAAGGSATDVLQNIPSVSVDNEGNVSLRNNTNVEVWVNGKPSGLTADNRAQVLQQMPAESIESIEVMTNPSAKFNPEGTAGIINLVLKKNRKAGYYGSVSAGIMLPEDSKLGRTVGASINYGSSKIDAYANIGYRGMDMNGNGNTERYNYMEDFTTLLDQTSKTHNAFNGIFARAGIDYHLDDKNTLSLSGFGMGGSGNSDNYNLNYLSNVTNSIDLKKYQRDIHQSGTRPNVNVNLDYQHNFDKKGSNISGSVSYSYSNRNSDADYVQTDLLSGKKTSDISVNNDSKNKELEGKIDFTKKFSEAAKLEAGWQSTFRSRPSTASGSDNETGLPLNAYYDDFQYKEQIHAAYITYGNRFFKHLGVQGGLRGEYMYRDMTDRSFSTTTQLPSKSYFELFPSLYLTYSLPKDNELQLNYTRRVNRPRGRQINPFKDYSDSTNISYGNPDLMPEFSSSFEFSYMKRWGSNSLNTDIYYHYTDKVIDGVSFLNGDHMESTYLNLTQSSSAGMELTSRNQLSKFLNLTSTLNFYYNKIDSARYTNPLNHQITAAIPEQSDFSWNARVMANFMLSRTFSGQVTGEYNAPRIISQGKAKESYSIDLGLRKTFMDKKLSLAFTVRDLLNSRKDQRTTSGDQFYQRTESRFQKRMFGINITYNFGNMKPNKNLEKKLNENNNQDMNGFD